MIQFLRHGFGQFNQNHLIGPSCWPHFDLLYLHEGKIELKTGNRKLFQMTAGDSILLYPDTHFEGKAANSSAWASIQHFEFLQNGSSEIAFPPWHDRKDHSELFQNTKDTWIEKDVRRAIDISRFRGAQTSREIREALLFLILAQLRDSRASPPGMTSEQEALEAARAWALAHLSDSISVEKMASQAGLSSSHFRNRFKKHYDESAGKFLLRNRIHQAQEILRETRRPIKQISLEVGYSNVISFHQAFQKFTGQTPANYRKENCLNG